MNGFHANWDIAAGATNYLLDVSTASNFASFVEGYANRSVGNVTTHWVNGLYPGATYYYRVRSQQNGVVSDSSATVAAQTRIGTMSVSNGPSAGGNALTIFGIGLGNGSDITNVTIRGIAAAIRNQTATSVTVVAGTGFCGTGDVQVHSISRGVITFANAYTYNPRGEIGGAFSSDFLISGGKTFGFPENDLALCWA